MVKRGKMRRGRVSRNSPVSPTTTLMPPDCNRRELRRLLAGLAEAIFAPASDLILRTTPLLQEGEREASPIPQRSLRSRGGVEPMYHVRAPATRAARRVQAEAAALARGLRVPRALLVVLQSSMLARRLGT